jgi:hypothetical protein
MFSVCSGAVRGAAAVAQVWQRRTLSIDRDESSAGLRLLHATKNFLRLPQKNLLFEVTGWRLSASAINSSTNDHSVGPLNSNFSRTVATKAANSSSRWLELHIADSFSLKSNGMGGDLWRMVLTGIITTTHPLRHLQLQRRSRK